MRVRVLVFGVLREVMGAGEVECEVPEGATTGEVLARMRETSEGRGGAVWGTLAVAVNEEYAGRDRVVRVGDVLALLPPVSGG